MLGRGQRQQITAILRRTIPMPELPEVETVRRGLEPVLAGQTVTAVEMRRPDLRFPLPRDFARRLTGARVETVERRAKYLILGLSSGDDVVMHLGMTGRFTIRRGGAGETPGQYIYATGANPAHDHVVFHFGPDLSVVYNDPRRFGFMDVMSRKARPSHPLFCDLGAEPLSPDLTAAYLASRAIGKSVRLKAFLMDQRNIAGLGNIYVSEALHLAGLSPNRSARSLADLRGRPTVRSSRLVAAIQAVLEKAIEAGGSTLRDYRHTDGSRGGFQDEFAVYDRDGEPCRRAGCGGQIKRAVHQSRATYFCGTCQR
jgi:formamidopyrimidine-DNA glycosylase